MNSTLKHTDKVTLQERLDSALNLGKNISLLAIEKDADSEVLGGFLFPHDKNHVGKFYDVLNGKRRLYLSEAIKLCTILECNLDELIK